MKRVLFLFTFIILLSASSFGQLSRSRQGQFDQGLWKIRKYEITLGLGTTQLYGDIGGFSKGSNALGLKDLSLKQTRINFSTGFRYRILDKFTARLNLALGTFHVADDKGSNTERGYEAGTFFFEPSLLGEYYFIRSQGESSYMFLKGKRDTQMPLLSTMNFYAFTGIGGIYYNVKPNLTQVTGTIKTNGFTAVIPFGIGANVAFSSRISLGVELSARYAFTDYLDGYSSIYSKSNDFYHFINFTFTYSLKTGKNGGPSFK